jgi:hypothetical protein
MHAATKVVGHQALPRVTLAFQRLRTCLNTAKLTMLMTREVIGLTDVDSGVAVNRGRCVSSFLRVSGSITLVAEYKRSSISSADVSA